MMELGFWLSIFALSLSCFSLGFAVRGLLESS
jgi:hypothetical protein